MDMLSRFQLIPERHRQTDGHTDRRTDGRTDSVLTRDKNLTVFAKTVLE